jgi:DNA-binding SARP family transcriptional activator
MTAEVQLLGPVRVVEQGRELQVGPARQRAVLAVLAISAGRVVTKDELLAAVWGQPRPASAASNLYSCIAGLRRVLDVESAPAGYMLGIEREQVDVRRFEQLYWRGKAAKDDRQAEDALVQALELWRGDALPKVRGPFAESERLRLAERRLATVEELSRVRLRRGAPPIAELEHMVVCHPERPVFRELLTLALAWSGRRAEALQLVRDTAEPSPALRRIQARILAGEDVYDVSA